jgi:branched-chain amino acid transport system permease protein
VSVGLQVVVTGLAAGAVYGLLAIGYALVFRLTDTLALAFGDLVGLAVFATLFIAVGTGPVSQTNVGGVRYLLAVACGLLVCTVVGVAGYLLVVEPFLLRGSTIGWIAGTLAIAFAIRAVLESAFRREAYVFPDPIPFERLGHGGFVEIGGASVQVRAFYVIAVAIALGLAAVWILEHTHVGRGLRAIADDAEGARLVGVPVEIFVPLAFGLVGAFAALAAIVASPSAPVTLETWPLVGVKGLAAAAIARFALPWPAFAVGLGLGLAEASFTEVHVGSFQPGSGWSALVPLALAVGVLALRPPADARDDVE